MSESALLPSVRLAFHGKSRIVNPLNRREHGLSVWRRGKAQEKALNRSVCFLPPPALPLVVTFTLISPGTFDEGEAIPAALKHVRDTIAAWLGCDDSPDAPVQWVYAPQQKCKRGEQYLEIAWEASDVRE